MRFRYCALLLSALLLLGNGTATAGHDDNEIEFKGTIEALPGGPGLLGDWRVGGRIVHVASSTRIDQEDGPVALGALVEVKGTLRSDGSVDATRIDVERDRTEAEIKFKGTIEILPPSSDFVGDWRVGGRIVHVSPATRIEQEHGPVAVGAFVEVEGTAREDGSLDAREIEVESNVAGGDGRDELKGRIEQLPVGGLLGDWLVGGRTVRVTSATQIDQEHGPVAIGAFVEVKGASQPDGSILASKVEVKSVPADSSGRGVNFKGTIESLPTGLIGEWRISGRVVHVLSTTRIKQEHGPVGVGVRVKVKGASMSDGSIVATRIQVRDSN